jgi:hypothetical protein
MLACNGNFAVLCKKKKKKYFIATVLNWPFSTECAVDLVRFMKFDKNCRVCVG